MLQPAITTGVIKSVAHKELVRHRPAYEVRKHRCLATARLVEQNAGANGPGVFGLQIVNDGRERVPRIENRVDDHDGASRDILGARPFHGHFAGRFGPVAVRARANEGEFRLPREGASEVGEKQGRPLEHPDEQQRHIPRAVPQLPPELLHPLLNLVGAAIDLRHNWAG